MTAATLHVIHPSGRELEEVKLEDLSRLTVEHAAAEARLRARNERGVSPYFALVREDGVNITPAWADVL